MDYPNSYLQGIYLGGFQVFDKLSFIPLSSLNLFFGPNSAGKSAVEDALVLIKQEFFLDKRQQVGYGFNELFGILGKTERFPHLKRHWRRLSEDSASFSPELVLGARFASDVDLIGALDGYVNRPHCDELGAINRFVGNGPQRMLARKEAARNFVELSYKPSKLLWWTSALAPVPENIDQQYWDTVDIFAKYRLNSTEEINDVHPDDVALLRDFVLFVNGMPIAEFRDGSGEEDSYFQLNFAHPVFAWYQPKVDFEEIATRCPDVVQACDGVVRFSHLQAERLLHEGMDSRTGFPGFDVAPELEAVVDELKLFYHSLHDLIMGNCRFRIGPRVPDSRMVPKKEDLCFLSPDFDEEPIIEQFCLRDHGDSRYRRLAWNADCLSAVNRMLIDHLFSERGYYVGLESLNLTFAANASKVAELRRLFLVDAQGRKLSFEEVGSGLGYVLPVLCAVSDVDQSDAVVFIQQPELHLHPALQAALGDVFVDGASHRQVIVETHSEHFLLRILKRIRQTASGRLPAPELRISPKDVSILYFDPSPTGVTQVRRIRINEDGEFLDRWPRGFFGERDQELFDE